MKQILKFIGVFLLSVVGGFFLGQLIVVLFTDVTLAESLQKFSKVEFLELGGIALFCMATFIVAIFLQLLLHEAGHLVGGLASGYKFVSFRIFNWVFIKESEKLRVKKFKIAGTGGQCLLTPPDRPVDEIPTKLYNASGVLANILFSTIVIGIWLICAFCYDVDSFLLGFFCIIFTIVGVFLAIINGIPMKVGGISNDGSNLKLLDKDLKSKEAFVIQLKANALVQQGVLPRDMPLEWFDIKKINFENDLEIAVFLMKASYLMDIGRIEESHLLLEEAYTHKDKMMGLLVKETECELIFTSLVTGRGERAKELFTPELQKYIESHRKVMSSKERTLWAVAYYMENNHAKAQQIYNSILTRKDDYLMQGEVKMDIELIERLLRM